MHRALSARWISRALRIGESSSSASTAAAVPIYLCPAVSQGARPIRSRLTGARVGALSQRRTIHAEATTTAHNEGSHSEAQQEQEFAAPQAAEDDVEFQVSDTEDGVLQGVAGKTESSPAQTARKLPVNCTGCGAFTQTHDRKMLGFFDLETKRVQKWLNPEAYAPEEVENPEDQIVNNALSALDSSQLEALGLDPAKFGHGVLPGQDDPQQPPQPVVSEDDRPPVCERCHGLAHHSTTGDVTEIPMFHPTVDALRETIEESPHKYNHIYHVIDAADFPMSLIPRLNVLLGDIPMRSKNRRSRAHKFMSNRQIEMSFIITRGDLLGPTKEAVDNMMPYLRDVMRDALGRLGGRIRLGGLRCVSAKRGWWTQQLREDIWKRGGAGWMVGKVNVGKSQLFEAVYPKGRMKPAKDRGDHSVDMFPRGEDGSAIPTQQNHDLQDDAEDDMDVGELLPPLQPATQYPNMPIVSSLPGTTASPIRIPFGDKKGELIDLPGLARSDLELFVKPEHRKSLVMRHRVIPEQISLTSTGSLLLGGGLVRITPKTPNLTFLMYNFTPLEEHVTSTEKALEFQNQTRESIGVTNITLPGMGEKIQRATTLQLNYDVTKKRAGPLTRKHDVGFQVKDLPFRVLSVDILIEGVGYVEVVAQVRAKQLERRSAPGYPSEPDVSAVLDEPAAPEPEPEPEKPVYKDPFEAMMHQRIGAKPTRPQRPVAPVKRKEPAAVVEQDTTPWPEIEVFTPEGRFVGSRRPIEGWLANKPKVKPEHKRQRPRKSMKGHKKNMKKAARAAKESSNSA